MVKSVHKQSLHKQRKERHGREAHARGAPAGARDRRRHARRGARPAYFEDAHLPGAINIPHDRVDELAPRLLPDKTARIVVYCASGPCQNSEIATLRLGKLGYTNVADYHEGKAEWLGAGLPVERGAAVAA